MSVIYRTETVLELYNITMQRKDRYYTQVRECVYQSCSKTGYMIDRTGEWSGK